MDQAQRSPRDRVFTAYWQDGSVDLFAGIATALIGLLWLADLVPLGALAPALTIPLWSTFRSRVVQPRLGQVRFDAPRRRRLRRTMTALIVAGCVSLLGWVALYFTADAAPSDLWRTLTPALPACLLALLCVAVAVLFDLLRFAWYSLPLVCAGVLVVALDADPGWAMLGGGFAIAAAGAMLLKRFVRDFPQLPNELDG